MSTKAQLELLLVNANDRITELQQQVVKQPIQDYLYYAYHATAATLEDHYTLNQHGWMDWMERADLTDRQLDDAAWARFAHVQQNALTYDPQRPYRGVVNRMKCTRMTTKRLGLVPWVLTWFSHTTFRDGRTDAELWSSFATYVDKYRWMQEFSNRCNFEEHYGEPYVCLMGAEDYWRVELCACQHCKDRGVAIFTH